MKVTTTFLPQSVEHFVEESRLCWLIRRMEQSEQPVAPTYGRAGGVDAMLPIIFSVAVTLAMSFRRGIANELPERAQKLAGRRERTFAPRNVIPPLPRRM